jgi:hypothetical protein
MRVLRAGGVYLLMPHGDCYESKSQVCVCARVRAWVNKCVCVYE